MDWRTRVACADEDPELFHPVGTSGAALLQIAEAKAVCGRCPVMDQCRAWALAAGSDAAYGVWGGLSEDERKSVALRRHARTEEMLDEQCRRATGSSRPELARQLLAEGHAVEDVARRFDVDPRRIQSWACYAA